MHRDPCGFADTQWLFDALRSIHMERIPTCSAPFNLGSLPVAVGLRTTLPPASKCHSLGPLRGGTQRAEPFPDTPELCDRFGRSSPWQSVRCQDHHSLHLLRDAVRHREGIRGLERPHMRRAELQSSEGRQRHRRRRVMFGHVEVVEVENLKAETKALTAQLLAIECDLCGGRFAKANACAPGARCIMRLDRLTWCCSTCLSAARGGRSSSLPCRQGRPSSGHTAHTAVSEDHFSGARRQAPESWAKLRPAPQMLEFSSGCEYRRPPPQTPSAMQPIAAF